mmetsp:Transcript_14743/g.34515  ORF Transcript_14743/g.34515 Transcript_14743/m.34515 type:complete len:242 (-) Transcript_14743:1939-2664(-)
MQSKMKFSNTLCRTILVISSRNVLVGPNTPRELPIRGPAVSCASASSTSSSSSTTTTAWALSSSPSHSLTCVAGRSQNSTPFCPGSLGGLRGGDRGGLGFVPAKSRDTSLDNSCSAGGATTLRGGGVSAIIGECDDGGLGGSTGRTSVDFRGPNGRICCSIKKARALNWSTDLALNLVYRDFMLLNTSPSISTCDSKIARKRFMSRYWPSKTTARKKSVTHMELDRTPDHHTSFQFSPVRI